MMMKLRMIPMHPLQLRTSEGATVRLMTINKRSSGGSLVPLYIIYMLFPFTCYVFVCVFLFVFVFQILNKKKWRSPGYDITKQEAAASTRWKHSNLLYLIHSMNNIVMPCFRFMINLAILWLSQKKFYGFALF